MSQPLSSLFFLQQSWHYLDTFCVDGNSDEVILFNFEIEYIMVIIQHQLCHLQICTLMLQINTVDKYQKWYCVSVA